MSSGRSARENEGMISSYGATEEEMGSRQSERDKSERCALDRERGRQRET